MQAVFNIARQEFRAMFVSPIAWMILIIFIIQVGGYFELKLASSLKSAGYGVDTKSSLTAFIYLGRFGTFGRIISELYLYIPLLTMGVISREIQSGSIYLLLSSPVRISSIVLGKYLGIIGFCFIMCLVLVATVIWGYFSIENMDYPATLTAIFGIFLLISAYASIGLFMSTLSRYQVVVAVATLAVLALFENIGSVGQSIPYIREITTWLALPLRSVEFNNGLISTENIFYYLSIIGIFLTFSVLKLSSGRITETIFIKFAKYGFTAFGFILFGNIMSLHIFSFYFDMSATNKNSLSEASMAVMADVKGPWKVTNYVNVNGAYSARGGPGAHNWNKRVFVKYSRVNSDFTFKQEYYYAHANNNQRMYENYEGLSEEEIAFVKADLMGIDFNDVLPSDEVLAPIDLKAEDYVFVRMLEWNGKVTPLRIFNDPYRSPSESEISVAFMRIINGPKQIASVIGHEERSIFSDKLFEISDAFISRGNRSALINHGFEHRTLELKSRVPDDIDILIIADPKLAYSANEMESLKDYIQRGGDIVFSGEALNRDIQNAILEPLGVALNTDILSDINSQGEEDEFIQTFASQLAFGDDFNLPYFARQAPLVMNGATSLVVTHDAGFKVDPLLVFNRKGVSGNPVSVALGLQREKAGRKQRIYISSDTDFWVNYELSKQNSLGMNKSYLSHLFYWMSDGHSLLNLDRYSFKDKRFSIEEDSVHWLNKIFNWIVPILIGLFGAQLLIRRKRK